MSFDVLGILGIYEVAAVSPAFFIGRRVDKLGIWQSVKIVIVVEDILLGAKPVLFFLENLLDQVNGFRRNETLGRGLYWKAQSLGMFL